METIRLFEELHTFREVPRLRVSFRLGGPDSPVTDRAVRMSLVPGPADLSAGKTRLPQVAIVRWADA